MQLIDDCFYVKHQRFGTWNSYDKDGKCLITSLTEEECVKTTRFWCNSFISKNLIC